MKGLTIKAHVQTLNAAFIKEIFSLFGCPLRRWVEYKFVVIGPE